MQLVADGIERGERETESELAGRKLIVSFLTERAQYKNRENKILAEVTELADQNVNRFDV